jgi:hypothetical protein
MNKNNFSKLVQNSKTFDELETLKQGFLNECENQHKRIAVANLLNSINSFGDAKIMFESTIPYILNKKGGKSIVNRYTKLIKENKSLKTLYAYHEGLNENTTPDSKKNYITEALSMGNTIDNIEYYDGLKSIVNLISESFKLMGNENVLSAIKLDDNVKMVNESLDFLVSTPKTIKNLNQYINHINTVSETITESKTEKEFNIDITLEDVLKNKNNGKNVMESIFDDSLDKETTFINTKNICLNMIKEQRTLSKDDEISQKLDEMAEKLSKKTYDYETYTKDMLFMTELQEVLN